MPDNSSFNEKAVATAAAAAARKGIPPILLAFLASCATPARTPYTLADHLVATVPGFKDIRFYADMPQSELAAQRDHMLPRGSGSDRRQTWLVLSAGGAIAASDAPDKLRLIGDVLEASASIPAIFPPVRVAATANGTRFEELHADGDAIRQLHLFPDAFFADPKLGGLKPDIYVVVNAELAPSFSVTPQQSIRIAERALASLEKSSATRSVAELAEFARPGNATFRLVFIDRAIPADRKIAFDPNFMQRAFALGQSKGRAGLWEFSPRSGPTCCRKNDGCSAGLDLEVRRVSGATPCLAAGPAAFPDLGLRDGAQQPTCPGRADCCCRFRPE